MSYKMSLSHRHQTNTPEYDKVWLGQQNEQTRLKHSAEESPHDWQTPHVTSLPANRRPSRELLGRNDSSIQILNSSHDLRQLPVAQVSPNVPHTPPTRLQSQAQKQQRKDEGPRKLFDSRMSTNGRLSGSHMTMFNQRPPVNGTTLDHWRTSVEGSDNDPNSTSNNFDVLPAEETLNQSAFGHDTPLKPREKHHSGSSSRRRSSSVPPKKRHTLPGQQQATSPSRPTYPDPPGVHAPVDMEPSMNVPSQQYQPLGPFSYQQSSHKIQDLTSWQRTLNPGGHPDDLIGNKMRELDLAGLHHPSTNYYQPPYSGLQEPPPGVGKYTDPRLDPGGFSNTAPPYGTDYQGFERVVQAKDRILQEKDYIIQRQKLELAQLQEKARDVQASTRHNLYPASSTDKSLDLLVSRLQEKDYEIHRLQAQLAQMTQAKKSEIEQLTQELGKTEHDVKKLLEKDKDGQSALKKERDRLAVLIKTKETAHEEIRDKYRKLKEKYEGLKANLQTVERHLGTLPTAEEYAKSTQSIASLQQTESLLKERIASLESTLTEAREVRREKESVIATLEEKNTDMEFEIQRLKAELGKMQQAMGADDGTDPTSLRLCHREEFDEIMNEKERLIQEVHQLKKVADSKHKQIRKLQTQHQEQVRDIERRLMQEEDCTIGLREEIKNREMDIAKMRLTLKDLSDQNQELLSVKLKLQDKVHKQENIISSDRFRANKRLAKELSECVTEVQSLLQTCIQTAEGAEPNLSKLLVGRPSSSLSVDFGHPETDSQAAQRVLEEVQQIRQDVDILRAHIRNKYAESVTNDCITQ